MENSPYRPTKDFLPSKKILVLITVLIIIGLASIFIPKLITGFSRHATPAQQNTLIVTAPVGNPLTRDSNGNGVPDWEEVAAGLDPYEKNAVSPDSLPATTDVSDSSKLSYTIFEDIVQQTNQSGNFDGPTISNASQQEFLNYFKSLAPAEYYSTQNISVVQSTPAVDQTYKETITAIGGVELFNKTFQKDLTSFLNGGAFANSIKNKITQIETLLPKMAAVPIPSGIADDQIATFNALDGFDKVLQNYDITNTDPLYQFANETLIKMYEWAIIKHSVAVLAYYRDPSAAGAAAAVETLQTSFAQNQLP
jgi:hypothetical protein